MFSKVCLRKLIKITLVIFFFSRISFAAENTENTNFEPQTIYKASQLTPENAEQLESNLLKTTEVSAYFDETDTSRSITTGGIYDKSGQLLKDLRLDTDKPVLFTSDEKEAKDYAHNGGYVLFAKLLSGFSGSIGASTFQKEIDGYWVECNKEEKGGTCLSHYIRLMTPAWKVDYEIRVSSFGVLKRLKTLNNKYAQGLSLTISKIDVGRVGSHAEAMTSDDLWYNECSHDYKKCVNLAGFDTSSVTRGMAVMLGETLGRFTIKAGIWDHKEKTEAWISNLETGEEYARLHNNPIHVKDPVFSVSYRFSKHMSVEAMVLKRHTDPIQYTPSEWHGPVKSAYSLFFKYQPFTAE